MAGIIKAGQTMTGGGTVQPTTYQLADVSQQANAYVIAARAQAQEIIAAAKRESEALRTRAEQQGLQAALAKAEEVKRKEVAKQLETLMPALRKAIESFERVRQDWLLQCETSAVRLACAIAARVIRREAAQDPEITLRLLRESLELAAGQQRIRIYLHAKDLDALKEQIERLTAEWRGVAEVEILASKDVPQGSCRVTTEFADIDQRFDQQLARIQEELVG